MRGYCVFELRKGDEVIRGTAREILCDEVDEKIEEVKSNMNAFDRLLGEPLKALGEWLHD